QAQFAGGICFVDLSTANQPDQVPAAIATALGVPESAGQSLVESVTRALGGLPRLLLLDNFEHLLPAAPLVATLLHACPRRTVRATSRELLRVSGEQHFPVAPLPYLPPADGVDLATLGASAAVQLFVARAEAQMPDFALTAATARAVAGICARVEG